MSKQQASVSIGSESSLFNGTIPIGASISFQSEDKYFVYGREMCDLYLFYYLFKITTFLDLQDKWLEYVCGMAK
jgi:hypothetical protein